MHMKSLWPRDFAAGGTGIVGDKPKTSQWGCSTAQSGRFSTLRRASSAWELQPGAGGEVSDVTSVSGGLVRTNTSGDGSCSVWRGEEKHGGGNDCNAEQQYEILLWKARCGSRQSALMGDRGPSWAEEHGIWCYPMPCTGRGYVSAWSLAVTLMFSHIRWCIATHLLGHLLSCRHTRIRTATLHSYMQPFKFYTLPFENFLLLLDPLHHPSSPAGADCYDRRCLAAFTRSLTLQINNLT